MSGIRVTFSGLLSFVIGLVSIVTGLIFILIVTRQLTPTEFGTWGLIGGLTTYVLVIDPMISFWTTRQIARGNDPGRTSIVSTGVFSIIALFAYFLIVHVVGDQINIDKEILIFASIQIPALYFRSVLVSICRGYKPHMVSYGNLVFEFAKIPLAFFFIFFMDWGLFGVIIAVTIAITVNIIVLVINVSEKIKGKFNYSYFKNWIRLFWIPIYPQISNIVKNLDVLIFPLITGSVSGMAFWFASIAISNLVLHTEKISYAIYPKLLEGGKKKFLETNLEQVFYFAFPLLLMSLVFSKPALFTLNPLYVSATNIVIILTFLAFLRTFSTIFNNALKGIEKVDTYSNATFKDYIKSKLFHLPTIRLAQRCGYIGTLTVILLLIFPQTESDEEIVFYWGIVAFVTQIPYTLYLYNYVRKEFKPNIDIRALIKYLLTSIVVFAIMWILMDRFLVYHDSIFQFLPNFLPFVVIGVLGYLIITYFIDNKTKKLFHMIISEIKQR